MLDSYSSLSPRPIYDSPGSLHFGDVRAEAAAALSSTIVVPQLHQGLIRVSGADADSFLQGQLSNDLRVLGETAAQLASFNSPKGRMLAVLLALRRPDGVHLLLERGVVDAVLRRLRMFVLRARVTLDDLTLPFALLGLAGPQAPEALTAAGLPVPEAPMACGDTPDCVVLRHHGPVARFSLLTRAQSLPQLWQGLLAHAQPAGTNAWKLLEIRSGMPTVYPETQDHFVPQMANLDQLGGISFSKGCYTGQEVVARVHYLGEIKRRLYRLRTQAEEAAPATPVCDADHHGENVGEVVDSALLPDGSRAVLAVIQRAHICSGALRLGNPSGRTLILEE